VKDRDDYLYTALTIENFLDGKGADWDWDSYLSTRFCDSYLQEVQMRMNGMSNEFPPQQTGSYCGSEGFKVMRGCVDQLRQRRNEPNE